MAIKLGDVFDFAVQEEESHQFRKKLVENIPDEKMKDNKVTTEEIAEAIGLNPELKGKKIEFATASKVYLLQTEVNEILDAIGYPEAWVSDETLLSDFCLTAKKIEEASKKLGIDIKSDEYLTSLASRIQSSRQSNH